MEYCFTIPFIPVAQGRPIFSTRGGYGRAYDPPKSRDYKAQVRHFLKPQAPKELIIAPMIVEVTFYLKIPKSVKGKKLKQALTETEPHTKKPDIDNLSKGILDAMNGLIYKDDSYVFDLHSKKVYSDNPRTEIKIIEF